MFPLKDDAPRVSTPYVTYFLLAANIAVFLFELSLHQSGPRAFDRFIVQFGVVPARLPILLLDGGVVPRHLVSELGARSVTLLSTFLPFFTSMFLHANFWHLLANMWALWIFGDNVEDHLGGGLYLVLYLLSGVIGSVVQVAVVLAFGMGALAPTIGASGAIAGVMGAYLLLYPGARVLTFLFVFFLWLPAWVVLGYWFIVQFLSGAASALASSAHSMPGGVAFGAHVGGFISGIVLIKTFPPRPRRYRYYGA
jgi:membrane associated rhomboid family serine protease